MLGGSRCTSPRDFVDERAVSWQFVGFVDLVLPIGGCGSIEALKDLELHADRVFVFDVIDEILFNGLSDMCFHLT